jgi:hypothetical protein
MSLPLSASGARHGAAGAQAVKQPATALPVS